MKLLTAAQRKALLAAGELHRKTNLSPQDALVKWFDPGGRFTAYIFEIEEVREDGDLICYGFVVSPLGRDCDEWGRLSFNEVSRARNRMGLAMERDKFFEGVTATEIIIGGKRP